MQQYIALNDLAARSCKQQSLRSQDTKVGSAEVSETCFSHIGRNDCCEQLFLCLTLSLPAILVRSSIIAEKPDAHDHVALRIAQYTVKT